MASEKGFGVSEELGMYYSELQAVHHKQVALLDALKSQIDAARSSLIELESAELDTFRETKRHIDWMISDEPNTDEAESA